jgi:hypothetical protein
MNKEALRAGSWSYHWNETKTLAGYEASGPARSMAKVLD